MTLHELAAEILPAINATLNGLSGVLATCGWLAVRRRRIRLHRALMVAALCASALFLAGYLTRIALTGTHRFVGPPALRSAYLVLLGSHTTLAVVVAPLVLRAAWLGWRGRLDSHRPLARFTLPLWLYVSLTGVIIYVMLYRISGV